jgi:hypothetical protein
MSAVTRKFCTTEKRRVPLTALQKHEVFRRDQGKCTHRGLDGNRCNSERFIDVHHIIGVADGGPPPAHGFVLGFRNPYSQWIDDF